MAAPSSRQRKNGETWEGAATRRLVESGILEILLVESESGIQLKESGIPPTPWIHNSVFTYKDWNPVPVIRNTRRGIYNPRLPWISFHWAKIACDSRWFCVGFARGGTTQRQTNSKPAPRPNTKPCLQACLRRTPFLNRHGTCETKFQVMLTISLCTAPPPLKNRGERRLWLADVNRVLVSLPEFIWEERTSVHRPAYNKKKYIYQQGTLE